MFGFLNLTVVSKQVISLLWNLSLLVNKDWAHSVLLSPGVLFISIKSFQAISSSFIYFFFGQEPQDHWSDVLSKRMALGKQRKLAQVSASNAGKVDWTSNDKKLLKIKIWQVKKHFSDRNCLYASIFTFFQLLKPLALDSRLLAFGFTQFYIVLALVF